MFSCLNESVILIILESADDFTKFEINKISQCYLSNLTKTENRKEDKTFSKYVFNRLTFF